MIGRGENLCVIEEITSDDEHRQDDSIKPSLQVSEDSIQTHLRPIQQVMEACYKQMVTSVDAHFEALSTENRGLRQRLHKCEGELASQITNNEDNAWPISNNIAALDAKRAIADAHSPLGFGGSLKGDLMLQASVPVPLMMLANRQPPVLHPPAYRKEAAAIPPTTYDNRHLKPHAQTNPSMKYLTSPPRTPEMAWKTLPVLVVSFVQTLRIRCRFCLTPLQSGTQQIARRRKSLSKSSGTVLRRPYSILVPGRGNMTIRLQRARKMQESSLMQRG